jgi:hypothetical protein
MWMRTVLNRESGVVLIMLSAIFQITRYLPPGVFMY